jgi:hypothetical protein
MNKVRFLSAVSALLVCLSSQAGNRVLDTPMRFRTGSDTSTLTVAADFTRDGRMDVLNVRADRTLVSAGRGDGTFGFGIFSPITGQPRGIADFDRDGNPDLYLRTAGAAYTIMRGAGDGTFNFAAPVSGTAPDLLTAGDFNGDTFADLVAFTASTNVLAFYAGNGAGGLASAVSFPVNFSGNATDVATGDFDGDGKLDVLLAGDQQSAIAWNGGGSFTGLSLPLLPGKAAAAGDVNGDGRADAVIINYTSIFGGGTAYVAFGSLSRNLTLTQFPIEGNTHGDVTIAQMDGTGGSDIVIAMRDVTVYSHDGVNFRTPRSYAVGGEDANVVAAADFNGDGRIDVVTHPLDGWHLMYIAGNGDGTLAADPAFAMRPMLEGGFRQAVNASDLNGDGRLDLTFVKRLGTDLAVSLATATGFSTPVLTPLPEAQQFWDANRAGDLNADGRADVLLTSNDPSATEQFSTWFAQANGTFVPGPVTTGAAASRAALMADLTGDGRTDILDSGGRLYTALGSGAFSGPVTTGIAAITPMYAADVNHDGSLDVAAADPGLATAPVRVYLNGGAGTFGAAVDTGLALGSIDGFADVTGDGFPELVSAGAVYRGNGNGTFAALPFSIPEPDALHRTPWAADFDGDGHTDLAVSGAISYGAGDGTFESAMPTAAAGEIVSLGDFDGNGSPDVWMADVETGRIAIIRTRRRTTGTATDTMTMGIGGTSTDRRPHIGGQVLPSTELAELRGSVLVRAGTTAVALTLVDSVTSSWDTQPLLPMGTYTVSAIFSGDAFYGPITSSQSHTVEKRETYIFFPEGLTYPAYGEPLVMSARVSGSDPNPTGVITYRKGATTLGTSPAVPAAPHQGQLSVTDPALFPAGPLTISMEYAGDDGYLPAHEDAVMNIRKALRDPSLVTPPGKIFEGQPPNITVSFGDAPNVTGSVTFTWSGATYTVPVSNGQAVLTAPLAWGNGTLLATYSGDANYVSRGTDMHLVVYRSTIGFTPVTRATAALSNGGYLVTIAFSPLSAAASYDIYHSRDGAPLTLFLNWAASQPSYPTETLPAGSVGVYAVVARGTSGSISPMSDRDLASGFTFLDDPLLPLSTVIKAAHLTQLQNAINAVRVAAGLTATTFPAPTGAITAAQLTSLRQALTQARSALNLSTTISDPTITPGVTRVRAIHLQELRDAVK